LLLVFTCSFIRCCRNRHCLTNCWCCLQRSHPVYWLDPPAQQHWLACSSKTNAPSHRSSKVVIGGRQQQPDGVVEFPLCACAAFSVPSLSWRPLHASQRLQWHLVLISSSGDGGQRFFSFPSQQRPIQPAQKSVEKKWRTETGLSATTSPAGGRQDTCLSSVKKHPPQ
jgi:hypothetical protein